MALTDRSEMLGSHNTQVLEEFAILVGLITVQIIFAVYGVLVSHLLSSGISPLFLVIYGSLTTSIILSPFAIIFERTKWPKKFNPKLCIQLVLIAFGGVTLFQALILMGIKNTSPAVASAMPNLAPGLIFVIAWCLRFEKVDIKCKYSRAKIIGTLVCLAGALSISFLQGSPVSPAVSPHGSLLITSLPKEDTKDNWISGCMFLLAAVIALSCTMVLQAATLDQFPAPLTLCTVTSLIGAVFTGVLQLIQDGKLGIGSSSLSVGTLVAYTVLGGGVSGVCVVFQAWAVTKRGPVLVSMFNPIGTVCSAILSAITLGQAITFGSVFGMLLMFSGLYLVLWAKKREVYGITNAETPEIHESEKPLLS